MRTVENYIVYLPFSGRTAGVDQRWILAVNGRGHPIGIGLIFITIEHLDFVLLHKVHSAISSTLPFSCHWKGR
jgi:hypothetical protein